MSRREQARQLRTRLREVYCPPDKATPGVVFLTEVAAPHADRRADAIALHLVKAKPWIDGIEIKVDRQDWLDELADHTKADAWFGHTHRWWIAASEPGIVHDNELPDGWGLMVPDPRSERRMKTLRKPTVRTPDLTYAAVREWLKKLDTARAEAVCEAVERVRVETREALAEQYRHQLDEARAAAMSWQDRADRDLGRMLREQLHVTDRNLRAALADEDRAHVLAELISADHPTVTPYLTRQLQRLTTEHRQAATAIEHVLQTLSDVAELTNRERTTT